MLMCRKFRPGGGGRVDGYLPLPFFILEYPFACIEVLCTARKLTIAFVDLGSMAKLYKLILEFAGPQICEALKICATKDNLPVLFHCASGKDRAGLLSFLILRACGVSHDDCIGDYYISDKWGQMKEHFQQISGGRGQMFEWFMTVPLRQALRAPRKCMEEASLFLDEKYGGVLNYLDSIGFDEEWRSKLKANFVAGPAR